MTPDRLYLQQEPPEWRRSGHFFLIALALHVAMLSYPLKTADGKLEIPKPDTLMVRLVETVTPLPAASRTTQPPLPQVKPTSSPPRERPAPATRPILAMSSDQAPAPPAFSVPAPPAAPSAATAALAASPVVPTVTAAHFNAAYLQNPAPVFPPLSRRLGEEGKVLLRVKVSAEGHPVAVDLEKSSNFERLDEAARRAVSRWRFVPARRGDAPVEGAVIVPIVFRLDD
jgi:protein TonB